MNSSLLRIPCIHSVSLDSGWKICFYKEFDENLLDDGEVKAYVLKLLLAKIKSNKGDYREQLTIGTTPFLLGIFYDAKEVRLASPRLGQELFILSELEDTLEGHDEFLKHVEMLSALDPQDFPSSIQRITHESDLPDLLGDSKFSEIHGETDAIKERLLAEVKEYRSSIFEKCTDWGLSLTASYALFRIHLLKFIAILPSLDFDQKGTEVKRILLESVRRLFEDSKRARRDKKKGENGPIPLYLEIIFQLVHFVIQYIPALVLAKSVRTSVRFMASRFIAGESIELAKKSLQKLFESKRDVTLDQLGELVVSEKEADNYKNEVIKLIRGFSIHVNKGETNSAGIKRANVSVKVSALCSDLNPADFDYTYSMIGPRLKDILIAAKEEQVHLNVDAEHYSSRNIILRVYRKVLLDTPELKDFADTGIVLQAYLKDAYTHFLEILELAKERDVRMPVRIVKGAYWDAETIDSEAHSYQAPQFLNKEESDLMFRQLIVRMLEEGKHIQLTLASHNYSDHSFAVAYRNKFTPDAPVIEHQCLDMTYEALSTGMANLGWAVRNYVPIGGLLVGMGYLVRRIMENSSQVGVLTIMRSHHLDANLETPMDCHLRKIEEKKLVRDPFESTVTSQFSNVSPVRLYIDQELSIAKESMENFKASSLGKSYSNLFKVAGVEKEIYSSSSPGTLVGKIVLADSSDAQRAIDVADESYNNGPWSKSMPIERASVLLEAASIMLAKRDELAALTVYEAGKTLVEAYADVDEAIDFLNFYARDEVSYHKNNTKLVSRGVISAVTPWNFPVAIPCGMISSPLVAGNSVIVKSAGPTPLTTQAVVNILHEAGVPENVLIHLPGPGSEIGDLLVSHPKIAGVVFTGSKEVGMKIAHKASKRIIENKLYNIKFPVNAITEMGGKNAIVVTASAELDEAVDGVLYSAFGHAGQKCSACSRVLVDNRIKERFIERIKQAVLDIEVGSALDLKTYINPVITKTEKERLQKSIEVAGEEAREFGGRIIVDRSKEEYENLCVGPAVFELPISRAESHESFAVKELFGPVLHIVGYDDIDQAIELFNSTDYALTGGVYCQSQDTIDYITSKMECGNIYINRPNTGARVGIEPFGGFKLSGTGPKAGGHEYTKMFHIQLTDKMPNESLEFQRGSDYKFRCSTPCFMSVDERTEKICKALSHTIKRYETLFRGVYGEGKEVISSLNKWMASEYIDLRTGRHPNQAIPGQISYNDYSMCCERVILASFNSIPHIKTFVQFVTAVASGAGVTILARNEQSYNWWKKIVDIFTECGIPRTSLDLFFCTEALAIKAVRDQFISSIIVDGSVDVTEKVLGVLYDEKCDEKRMISVQTPYNAPKRDDFFGFAVKYLWVRSFAVNTMRHGAPMETEE